jgi:S-adenosylmethionine-diacylgycerolhomoserine-N-methlytransferase
MLDVSHAGRMDAIYRGQRHIYDLTRKYYLLGRDRLIDRLAPPAGGTILEVGCGTGRNLILAARRWPDARLFGLDISEAMLETARANVARAGLQHRVTFAAADATNFDPQALFGLSSFDRIFQSYTLSMIPDWRGAVREAMRHIGTGGGTGGELHIVDFGQQEALPGPWRKLLLVWLAQFHVTPRATLMQDVAAAAGDRAVTFSALYRGYAWSLTVR